MLVLEGMVTERLVTPFKVERCICACGNLELIIKVKFATLKFDVADICICVPPVKDESNCILGMKYMLIRRSAIGISTNSL